MEHKAIIILLALFSLGIKLGPKPPQFANDEIAEFLGEQFGLSFTTTADDDAKGLLAV